MHLEISKEIEISKLLQMTNIRTAVYIRLSREDGDNRESESVANQRDLIQEYIQRNQLLYIDEYIDDGYTGTNYDRPAFQRMLEDIKAGRIDTIVTKDLSRFREGTYRYRLLFRKILSIFKYKVYSYKR